MDNDGHAPEPRILRTDALDSWVFDLDNTLYSVDCDLFAQIDVRMGQYISDLLGVDRAEARVIQKRYYHEHGTTMRGLMLDHGIEPEHYLDFVHDIDLSPVPPAPALADALDRLGGRKFVFTNGSAAHAARVLARLGIAGRFEAVFDIAAADYLPKPHPHTYRRMLTALGVTARTAAFVEDSVANLAPAAALGMTTVWVRHGRPVDGAAPDHVHHVIDDLAAWLAAVADEAER
jgi:putative hydrolase of the HAD superfamily